MYSYNIQEVVRNIWQIYILPTRAVMCALYLRTWRQYTLVKKHRYLAKLHATYITLVLPKERRWSGARFFPFLLFNDQTTLWTISVNVTV
jgi:hypothetical protein